jgi:hypothetical protein
MIFKNPSLGNSFSLDTNTIVRKTMDGDTVVYKNSFWPNFEGFSVTFEALSLEEKDALKSFLLGSAGQVIRYKDHEGSNWVGIFTTPNPEFIETGSLCLYKVSLTFEGSKV